MPSARSVPAICVDARREILTLGEGFNTQVITLWCYYIVGREILTLGEGFNTQVIWGCQEFREI